MSYTTYWYASFDDGTGVSVHADTKEDAMALVALSSVKKLVDVKPLPYPGMNRIGGGSCPSFCLHPEKCQGHTCCTRRFACCD